MEKLNLPVTKSKDIPSKWLSMEDYMDFINLNLKYTVDKKSVREQKRSAAVTARFLLF
ncbi:MAG: hypothetical protein ABIG92_01850 [Candidatus Omnitrophota bacterium]